MIDIGVSAVHVGDCRALLREMPEGCVQTCVSSPPYFGMRDYGADGQLGLEPTPDDFVAALVDVFRGVRRVLRDDGTVWLNLGDSYASSGRGGAQGAGGALVNRAVSGARLVRGSSKPAGMHERARQAGVVGRAWTPPPPGCKNKDLIGVPWMAAFALRADGWYLRADIIWHKPNPLPESVADRPTKSHEYIFLLAKRESYFYDADAIREPLKPKTLTTFNAERRSKGGDESGNVKADNWARDVRKRRTKVDSNGHPVGANKRSVWTVGSQPYKGAHFATFPPRLITPCVLAGSRPGDLVLDPFFGAGTTGLVAEGLGRRWIGFDVNPAYAELARERIRNPGRVRIPRPPRNVMQLMLGLAA